MMEVVIVDDGNRLTVYELVERVIPCIIAKHYSENYIQGFRSTFRNLLAYCNKNEKKYFTAELAQQFMLDCYGVQPGTVERRCSRVHRAMDLLSDYQHFNAVMLRRRLNREFPAGLQEGAVNYLQKLSLHGRRENTLRSHRNVLLRFTDYLFSVGVTDYKLLSADIVNRYVKVVSCNYSNSVVRLHYSILLRFFQYLAHSGYKETDLSLKMMPIVKVSASARIPTTLDLSQIESILTSVDRESPQGKRDYAVLMIAVKLGMDNENYLKEGSRQFYLSSVRTFFRTIATLGIYRYAEITLPDVTRCLAKISETFPLGIFNLTGSMRSFARFMAEKHPELPDISPALVFSAAKRRRVYVGYTHEDAQKIFSAINRSSTMGMRDYAMIMLAYTTGLRGCDIVNLKFDSIDWDACELRLVQEKTNIPVSLPLDTKTGNAIADYILHARPKCKSEYIFLRVLRPYTKIGSMWTVIAKYAHIALGKDRKMNGPHAFRRGMGRQLLEANIPAPLICDILGHSSSVSLRQYTASSLEKLKVCAGTISAIPIAQEAML